MGTGHTWRDAVDIDWLNKSRICVVESSLQWNHGILWIFIQNLPAPYSFKSDLREVVIMCGLSRQRMSRYLTHLILLVCDRAGGQCTNAAVTSR